MKRTSTQARKVSIHSISGTNHLLLSERGRVKPWHQPAWQKISGRKAPVQAIAFDISQPGPAELRIKLGKMPDLDAPAHLEALTDTQHVMFRGGITGNPTVLVQATVTPPNFSSWRNKPLHWQIRTASNKITPLQSAPLDLYWINLSQVPPSLRRRGVPAEILETMARSQPHTPVDRLHKVPPSTPAMIAKSVFQFTPPRYDIWQGMPHFVDYNSWDDITLHYSAYVAAHKDSQAILNCYDVAAVLQYQLRLNGHANSFCFMQPFGYLRKTDLIGRVQCNNPFYQNINPPVVNPTTCLSRTVFGNHAFNCLTTNSAILDSTAGPHLGTELAPAYVDKATDNKYPQPPWVTRGTVADIGYYIGVTSVDMIQSISTLSKLPHLNTLKAILPRNGRPNRAAGTKFICGAWPDLKAAPTLGKGWKHVHDEIIPGAQEVLKLCILKRKGKSVWMKLYVNSRSHLESHNRFLTKAALSERADLPYVNGPADIGHNCVVSVVDDHRRCLAVLHNALLEVFTDDANVDPAEICRWYFSWANKHLIPASSLPGKLPKLNLKVSSNEEKQTVVELTSNAGATLDMDDLGADVRILASEDKMMMLDQKSDSVAKVRFLAIDKSTLLVNNKTMPLPRRR